MHIFSEKLTIVILVWGGGFFPTNVCNSLRQIKHTLEMKILGFKSISASHHYTNRCAKPQTHRMTIVLRGHLVMILDQRATINLFNS